jgi:histone deacetylase complex regulatory component SIN3
VHARREGEGDTGADGISRSAAYNDAYQYLMRVKSVFRDRRKVYEDFLDTMKLFKQGRCATRFTSVIRLCYRAPFMPPFCSHLTRMTDVGVIERIKHLFEGHKDLIMEFNMFVPDVRPSAPFPLDSHARALYILTPTCSPLAP